MEALIVSLGVITLAEIGDKTQLLAFLLAAQFKKPLPIILGILTATLINHSLAGLIGIWITTLLKPNVLRWILGISFILMAIWTLIPDEIEQDEKKYPNILVFLEQRLSLSFCQKQEIKHKLQPLPWQHTITPRSWLLSVQPLECCLLIYQLFILEIYFPIKFP